MFRKTLNEIITAARTIARIFISASERFYWDDCLSRASSLAYTSILALLPLSVIGFWIANSLGYDHHQLREPVSRLLQQALPAGEGELLKNLQSQIISYIQEISAGITKRVRLLGPATILVLVVTCIALVNTIESALNIVWRVTSNLGILSKLVNFWAVVSLGPLVALASLVWNQKVSSFLDANPGLYTGSFAVLEFFIPVTFVWFALTFLFYKLPSARVRFTDAVFGAFIAAVLFELLKRVFAYYVGLSTTYSNLYGVLTSVPLFLLWIYLVWLVVLYGAELSYQAGAINILRGLRKYASELGEVGSVVGLSILLCVGRRFKEGGEPPTEGEIAIEVGSDPVLVRTCLDVLSSAGLLTASDEAGHKRTLTRAPDKISISDVVTAFQAKRFRKEELDPEDLRFFHSIRESFSKTPSDTATGDITLADFLKNGAT